MFFQQSHTARNAVDEVEENEMGVYDPPPWMLSRRKRISTASTLSSRSRRTGSSYSGDHIIPCRASSVECAHHQPSRGPSITSRGPGIYCRQSSAVGSITGQGRSTFAATKPSGNPVCRWAKRILSSSFGLFLFIQTYLCFGAVCFMWLEAAKEEEQMNEMEISREEMAQELVSCAGNVSCHVKVLKRWENDLLRFPQIYLEIGNARVWSWIYSYYCSFTIISTIGYGNVTPLSVFGRLFAVVYAVVGIPLMLLFITDIGNKFARWVKIAIIKFRKLKYKISKIYKETGKESSAAEANGGEEENHEVEAVVENEVEGGCGIYIIPEVHINMALSTLEEEACELETKEIGCEGGAEKHSHGYGKDQTNDKVGSLHVHSDNSDYGGSNTGMEGNITDDIPNNTHEIIVPSFTNEGLNRDELVPHAAQQSTNVRHLEVGGVEVDSYYDDDKLDLSLRLRAGISNGVEETAETCSPAHAGVLIPKREDTTVKDDRTERVPVETNRLQNSVDEAEICKYEPSDVLHTSSLGNQIAVGECGQSMQNVQNVRTGDGVILKSHDGIGRNTGTGLGRTVHNSPKPRQHSSDSESVDINAFKLLDFEKKLPAYFQQHSCPNLNLESDKEHVKLSIKKSRSLEGIGCLWDALPGPEPTHHRPALKRTHPHRTSLPGGVSFQTKPAKQNGRLPNRLTDPVSHSQRADGNDDGDFRDRTATDSGVASSTSNSTECSPKRRFNSAYLSLVDSSDDNGNRVDGDDVISEDDVMDSEEEKIIEKLRQVRYGAARPSEVNGQMSMRVSEVDIAMLSNPLWFAFLLLLIYLLIGAGCFAAMQGWTFLDGFYYCFISLSTIGFGDLVFLPQNIHAGLIFSFLYSFVGLCFTSMCMSLCSMELTSLSRRMSAKFGVYRGRIRSIRAKRWASRRRRTIRAPSPKR